MSAPLPIKMQRDYEYSKWDSVHEPLNIVENILKDDNSVFKTLSPELDFTLDKGDLCYISEVLLWPGDSGPAKAEIFVSNTLAGKWSFVKAFECARSGMTRMVIPGEYIAKYLRVKCANNLRGGNIVGVRYVIIKGLNRADQVMLPG